MAGAATLMVAALDVAAAFGFCTVTLSGPALPNIVPGRVAVIWVADPAVTVSAVLPTYTTEPAVKPPEPVVPGTKFVPFTVMVVSEEPAASVFGLIDRIAGVATFRLTALETCPPFGFCTVTLRVPALASAPAGTVALIWVAEPAVT